MSEERSAIMEAPEKIYLNPLLMEDGESIVRQSTFERQRDSQVEYTRTDAFIDKACKWLENHNDYQRVHVDMTQCIIDFRKAMESI